MTVPQPTLLLTRPEAQSLVFLEQCEALAGRKLPAVISPILRIEAIGELPRLDDYATLIFTSGNGVRCLAERADLKGRKVRTVGNRTADLARSFGADAKALGDDSEAFVKAARLKGPVLLCRGTHGRGDLIGQLRARGIQIEEAVIYDQVEQQLSPAAKLLLAGNSPVLVPVFSPRSAGLLAQHTPIKAPVTLLAISANAADAWTGPGRILIAKTPTADSLCALAIGLI